MRFFPMALCLLFTAVLGACAAKSPPPPPAAHTRTAEEEELTEEMRKLLDEHDGGFIVEQCAKAGNGVRRDECRRRGEALKTVTANEPLRRKTTRVVKQTLVTAKGKKVKKTRKVVLKGRCQPQCLTYARCRSGFMSCRMGNTNPLRWWPCAQKEGATSRIPAPGSVLLLDRQDGRRMRVGHAVYVEEVCRLTNGKYLLLVSHANYDRMCGLDIDARVLYDADAGSADFLTGAWAKWGRNLKALGFVTK